MKKYFIFAASALALASCSSDDFLGDNAGSGKESGNTAIQFSGETGKTTRTDKTFAGKEAADKLGNKFYVLGTKGTLPDGNPTETKVFDNYQVSYKVNTAGTTDDNTNDWRYAGLAVTGNSQATSQTIKYWDYSAPQYDFIAYSLGGQELITDKDATLSEGKVYASAIQTPKKDNASEYASFSLRANSINDLKKCYYTDVTPVEKENYNKPVSLTFKNLTAKVRVAFYETIPGYSVKELQFYEDATTAKGILTDKTSATLFTTGDDKLSTNGTVTVTYPVVGKTNKEPKKKADYNKAFVSVSNTSSDQTTTLQLGTVKYDETPQSIGTTIKGATFAGDQNDSYYTPVLPADPHSLTLRINYTLVSDDGSKEEIHVYGAKAVVPASYTAWQPNYAYTYIFKISDNTNGSTSIDPDDPEGLFPITFDAVVADVDNVDFNHESITTVSTPSVTSYVFDKTTNKVATVNGNDKYVVSDKGIDIYFSVSDLSEDNKGVSKKDLDKNGKLYNITQSKGLIDNVTEAQVIDALQMQAMEKEGVIYGRNTVGLKEVKTTFPTTIPTEDGKGIKVDENSTALYENAKDGTYAYVYLYKKGEESTLYTAYTWDDDETVVSDEMKDLFYTDHEGKNPVNVGEKLEKGKTYFMKITNNNNVYGVKVIRVYQETA